MARAKVNIRENSYIIISIHKAGHASIQEYYDGHPRPPIVLTARQASNMSKWFVRHRHESADDTFDPVAEKAAERRERYGR